nr:EOG090X0H7V [Artemia franciscana]
MTRGKLKQTIFDKPISKGKQEVSSSIFALLFSEMIDYSHNRSNSIQDLETRLSKLGYHVGQKMLDVVWYREKGSKRETKLLQVLLFIKSIFWKNLFGKEADKLEHSGSNEREYYLIEKEPLVNRYISVPKDKGNFNPATFAAGVVEAVLDGSGFPAKTSAVWHEGSTYICIVFDELVIELSKSEDR